ncbi:MAG: hypothetical protein V7739_16105, partial [Motiliproteus sp.]
LVKMIQKFTLATNQETYNKRINVRHFVAGQSFCCSVYAWLRHYRVNKSTKSLPIMRALTVLYE